MRNLSEQFHSGYELADWIKKSFDTIKALKDKVPFISDSNHAAFGDEAEFWTMGPKENEPGKYFVYWHSIKEICSMEREILSISIIPDTPYLMMFCSDHKWRKFDRNKSAWNWAKVMDLFLHGAYTDIPPMSIRDIIERITD